MIDCHCLSKTAANKRTGLVLSVAEYSSNRIHLLRAFRCHSHLFNIIADSGQTYHVHTLLTVTNRYCNSLIVHPNHYRPELYQIQPQL